MPTFPPDTRRSGASGKVVAEILVSHDGVPQNVAVAESSGNPAIDVAIAAALLDWRFYPWIENGQPIEVVTRQTVEFDVRTMAGPAPVCGP
jgi:protein TonB